MTPYRIWVALLLPIVAWVVVGLATPDPALPLVDDRAQMPPGTPAPYVAPPPLRSALLATVDNPPNANLLAAADRTAARPSFATADFPYRFVGTTGPDGIVLFGRGRVVTLQNPGPLDDEYAVESVMERQLLVRHIPSGRARFVDREVRPVAPESSATPDDSSQD